MVDHRDAAVLGTVTGRVQAAKADVADPERVVVGEGVVRILDRRDRMDAHRDPMLERKPAVARDVVGMRVRLDRADDPHVVPGGDLEQLLDREWWVDHDRLASCLATHEVRGATEILVDQLAEEHDPGA